MSVKIELFCHGINYGFLFVEFLISRFKIAKDTKYFSTYQGKEANSKYLEKCTYCSFNRISSRYISISNCGNCRYCKIYRSCIKLMYCKIFETSICDPIITRYLICRVIKFFFFRFMPNENPNACYVM